MFILGDEGVYKARLPWVTFSLIIINILAFSAQCFLGEPFTIGFSVVPYEISHFTDLTKPEKIKIKEVVGMRPHPQKRNQYQYQYKTHTLTVPHYPGPFPIILTLFTSMFLHGDLFHLIGNMWFLAVFGRNVEHSLDHGRFLLFYVTCGIIGAVVFVISDPNSVLPALGASGAISGIMGAYVAIYPLNKIKVWVGGVPPWGTILEVPALVVVGLWFLVQYLAAWYVQETGDGTDGTGYWCHLGGFLAGLVIIWSMVLYLKWQQPSAQEQTAEEKAAAQQKEAATPAPQDQPDPFRACLPNTPSSPPADPFGPRRE